MKAEEFSERLWTFSARLSRVVDALPHTRTGRHVAAQLVRCGTSSAPNYDEACVAESRRDFAHKIGIAAKEMRESRGWLGFIIRVELLPAERVQLVLDESIELLRMLAKSASTARKK